MIIKMNKKIKNILKIATLWLFTPWVLVYLLEIITGGQFDSFNNMGEFFTGMFLFICYCLFPFVCFIPTIILLCFLCKKLKTTCSKILLISFAIPFTNMVYFFIAEAVSENFLEDLTLLSISLGFFSLILLILLFCLTLITPQRWLALKKEFLLTEVCMFVFGWLLIFAIFFISDKMLDLQNTKALNLYKPAIEYINNFKAENKKYPVNIEEVKLSENNILPDFEYKTYDNNEGFVLTVFKESPKYYNYRYCSSEKYEGCKVEKQAFYKSRKVGDWIEMYYKD